MTGDGNWDADMSSGASDIVSPILCKKHGIVNIHKQWVNVSSLHISDNNTYNVLSLTTCIKRVVADLVKSFPVMLH